MEIIIKGDDKKLLKQVEDLARKLGLIVSRKKQTELNLQKDRSEKLFQIMEEIAASNAFGSIKDLVVWQREQRKYRPLPGRE
ncbi:hypothetical protein G3O08_14205 [Cryomorpha ignava]|uniref:Uncharacterized protein n=1 Tax=Cryomorpha ignava TaxID=101383 RepID=A0A7K3WT71_9FLAO|nr:hypothetical protein [Cryomorpha ignava]NEN24656.1 hypothetical protein [Cryomorpha ignava]